ALSPADPPRALAPRERNPDRARGGRGPTGRRAGAREFPGDEVPRTLHREDREDGHPPIPTYLQPGPLAALHARQTVVRGVGRMRPPCGLLVGAVGPFLGQGTGKIRLMI